MDEHWPLALDMWNRQDLWKDLATSSSPATAIRISDSWKQLQAGETILIQARTGVWHRFTVRDREIVDSRTATISTQEDKRHLILVTCYPFHAIVPGGPLRYMVTAETVERMAED